MRNLKSIIATTVLGLVALTANAQNPEAEAEAQALGYKPQPYTFVQVQGGVNKVFSPGSKFNPTFSVGVGRMFSNIVGARLHFNGIETKNGLKSIGANYKFKYITGNVDLMLNVFNIFKAKNSRPIDLYLIGGIGANLAWGNKDFSNIVSGNRNAVAAGTATAIQEDISNAWGPGTTRKQLLNHNIRFGVLADFNICKNFSIGVEVDLNSLDDRFNSKFNNSDDWMLTAQLSLTYKFGHKKVKAPEPAPVPPVVVREPEPEPVPVPVIINPVNKEIFYLIRESDLDADRMAIISKVADWYKANPEKQKVITVDGYADKGTGNPRVNKEYARQRAEKAAQALQDKGIPSSQIKVDSHGDTIQPFAENDKNRCVIIVGKCVE
jgi:outer membrane protein OmpA-like peptidoglycan-associated protein